MLIYLGVTYILVNGVEARNAGKGQSFVLREYNIQNNRVRKQYDQQHYV